MDMNDLFGDYQNGNYSSQAKQEHPLHQNDFSYGHENDNVKGKKNKGPKQKKKGGGFKVFLLLLLIIAIAAGGAYVYIFTDTFRTPKELMGKYMMLMVAESENDRGFSWRNDFFYRIGKLFTRRKNPNCKLYEISFKRN